MDKESSDGDTQSINSADYLQWWLQQMAVYRNNVFGLEQHTILMTVLCKGDVNLVNDAGAIGPCCKSMWAGQQIWCEANLARSLSVCPDRGHDRIVPVQTN